MDHQIANGMIPVGVQTLVFEDRSKYALTPCLKSETIFFISTQDLTYLCFQKMHSGMLFLQVSRLCQ